MRVLMRMRQELRDQIQARFDGSAIDEGVRRVGEEMDGIAELELLELRVPLDVEHARDDHEVDERAGWMRRRPNDRARLERQLVGLHRGRPLLRTQRPRRDRRVARPHPARRLFAHDDCR
jgi:hypothetical protein